MEDEKRGPWLNSRQAAEYLGLTFKAFTRMRQLGRIPEKFIHKLGRRLRFRPSELDQLINLGTEEGQK